MPLARTTKGRIVSVDGDAVVFRPTGSTYELHLRTAAPDAGPIDTPVRAVLRAKARKVYSVRTGGLFVTPIVGPTRILQGRVIDLSETELSVQCVVTVNVTLPKTPGAIELGRGPIESGSLVNIVLEPGATIQVVAETAPPHTAALTAPAAPVE